MVSARDFQEPTPAPGARMPGHVFIVEDNALLVQMYRSIFLAMDCRVTHAPSTREALRLLDGVKADLIIVDDDLPDGSGLDATSRIRSQLEDADTPIIATVSQPAALDDAAMHRAGYASIVMKPFQVGAFSALARRHLGRQKPVLAAA
jgi:DNA-binding response OmpR family regulator